MKRQIIIALAGLMPFIAAAQNTHNQPQQNFSLPTVTSVVNAPSARHEVTDVGNLLYAYRKTRMTGTIMEMGGAAMVALNLVEMNRTNNPKSRYTPMFVVGGGFAVAGYIINHWVAPGYLEKAGISLQANMISIDLHK